MEGNSELWHQIFAVVHPFLEKQHRLFGWMPSAPRCRLCRAPFAGVGGMVTRLRKRKPSPRNRNYCNSCDGFLKQFPGGAEVEMSVLFADIRGSTEYARGAHPAQVQVRINTFLSGATDVVTDRDGFVMAFYGDCIVACWPPGYSGEEHAAKALEAGRGIVGAMAALDDPIPVGVGLNCGDVFIGTVDAAEGLFRDVSIFGLEVNVAARLAAAAAAGEVLATTSLTEAAGFPAAMTQDFELDGIGRTVRAMNVA
jgi:adenylate cyclase